MGFDCFSSQETRLLVRFSVLVDNEIPIFLRMDCPPILDNLA